VVGLEEEVVKCRFGYLGAGVRMANYGGGGGCSGTSICRDGWARGVAERRLGVSLLAAAIAGAGE
jgi:hypothetical protein